MDSTSRVLLDYLQRAFPVEARPFHVLALKLGVSEESLRKRVDAMKGAGIVRQISAIFNTGALGYRSSLVAMRVPDSALDSAVGAINAYPGVSHNYLRPGYYNVWFTIAVPPGCDLESQVSELSREAGGWPVMILPAVRKYKLAVVLDVLEDDDGEESEETRLLTPDAPTTAVEAFRLEPRNIEIVRCIQNDLPVVERPFSVWSRHLDMQEEQLLELIRSWVSKGWIRRFAAVLNHRRAGFKANGMVVWRCPEESIDEKGRKLATFPEVSHCYHRPAHPDWPYNLYAMVHGKSHEECEEVARRLSRAVALTDHRILFSTREFKKTRLKLFWHED